MMHAKAQACIRTPQDGEMGIKVEERWRALMQGGLSVTNDNVLESNGQREQDKEERERGRE